MELGSEIVEATLADYRSAPIPDGLKATLTLVEKLTRDPDAVGAPDVAAVRRAGVPDGAIRHAVYICAMFNNMTRVSRPLDFEPVVGDAVSRSAQAMLRHGYRIPPPAPWRRLMSRE